jgi:hypothetical protein
MNKITQHYQDAAVPGIREQQVAALARVGKYFSERT